MHLDECVEIFIDAIDILVNVIHKKKSTINECVERFTDAIDFLVHLPYKSAL